MPSRWWIGVPATLCALFHVVMVAIPIVMTGGVGESQGFRAAYLDFPIVWLLGWFPGGSRVLYGSSPAYVWIFSIGGTLMYALVGAALGAAARRLRRGRRAS
jgi:hypothetical protein